MSGQEFTQTELLGFLRLDAEDAAKHARCGPLAPCRINALAKVDEDLDALAVAVQRMRDVGSRT